MPDALAYSPSAGRIREATTSQGMAMRVGEVANRMRLEGGVEEAVPLIEEVGQAHSVEERMEADRGIVVRIGPPPKLT